MFGCVCDDVTIFLKTYLDLRDNPNDRDECKNFFRDLQFKQTNKNIFFSNFIEAQSSQDYFSLGLALLKVVNPQINYTETSSLNDLSESLMKKATANF